jgi:hypothetical protein
MAIWHVWRADGNPEFQRFRLETDGIEVATKDRFAIDELIVLASPERNDRPLPATVETR